MKKTYEGRDIHAAVAKAAKVLGVEADALDYKVLAGQAGGFALIEVKSGEVGGAAAAAGLVEKLTGSPSAGGDEDRGGRRDFRDRGDRGRGDRDRDRGRGRDRDRGGRGRDRDGGGRGRDRDRGGRGGRGDRGDRRPRREPPRLVQDGPTEVKVFAAEGQDLSGSAQAAADFVHELFEKMGMGCEVSVTEEDRTLWFEIAEGPYHEGLIADEQRLLEAFELLTDKIANPDRGQGRKRVVFDSGAVKRAADEDLGESARDLARRALEESRVMKMGPLDPRARRLVHMALKEVEGVETRSEGEGVFRRVCIIPK